jgi:hypothetical protein
MVQMFDLLIFSGFTLTTRKVVGANIWSGITSDLPMKGTLHENDEAISG